MPVPMTTATRSAGTPASAAPESRQASSAATTATCWLRSRRRARTRSICSAGSVASRATSWAGKSLIQSSVIRLTPDVPARRASQVLATSPPRGVVAPSPVTTTSAVDVLMDFLLNGGRMAGGTAGPGPAAGRRDPGVSALVLLDEADRVADGLDVAELVVGDGDTELVLDGGGDLDHRQRVDVEVVGERLLGGGVGRGHAGDLLQDLGQAGLDLCGAAHAGPLSRMGRGEPAVVRDVVSREPVGITEGPVPARRT